MIRVALVIVLLLVSTRPAHAYIDPNAGGLLFQLLFPLLAAVAALWAAFRSHVSAMFRKLADSLRRRLKK